MDDTDRDNHQGSDAGETRRDFLKTGLKGAVLLPYVAPVVETINLSKAHAQGGSPIGNDPPPPDPPPVVSYCDPDTGAQGETLDVTVYGLNFQDPPFVNFKPKIAENSINFISSTEILCNIKVNKGAAVGGHDVLVRNPDTQQDTLVNGFTVYAPPPPTVISCNPSSGARGQTLDVTITGTDFVSMPVVNFKKRIDENSTIFFTSTTLVTNITIRNNAQLGGHDVQVKNPDGQRDILVNGFTVTT